jgi:1,2-diacylglycerol 3-alpha-glucosyltransferase
MKIKYSLNLMNILFSTPSFLPWVNGITYRVKMMIDYFEKHNCKVTIVTSYKKSVKKYKNSNIYILPSKRLPNILGGKKYKNNYIYKNNLENIIEEICNNHKIDIIHIFGPDKVNSFIKASKKIKIPLVGSYNTEVDLFFSEVMKIPKNMSKYFVLISQYYCKWHQIKTIFGTSNESIRKNKQKGFINSNQNTKLMLPIINTKLFKPTYKNIPKLFKNSNNFKIIYCGRTDPEKNIETIITSLKYLENVLLIIIGDGSELQQLKNLSNSLKVDKKVLFLGKINNEKLSVYYSNSDVFVTASKVETCGFTTLEAMACKTPALVYPSGGSLDLVQNEFNGFYCKQPTDFANKINLLKNNNKMLKKLSENAFKSVQKFTIKKSCETILKDYQKEINKFN